MTRDEQKSITSFIESTVKRASGVPEMKLDVEADAIVRALFVRNPEAAYRVTILAMTQADALACVKNELAEIKKGFRGNWLSRLLKKQKSLARGARRDPRLSIFPQNIR